MLNIVFEECIFMLQGKLIHAFAPNMNKYLFIFINKCLLSAYQALGTQQEMTET